DSRYSSYMISAILYVVSSPTKSSSVNGPMGYPAPSIIPLSMSAMDATPASSARIASIMYGTRRRLTTNPELSRARIGSLPSDRANASARSIVAELVPIARTTSTIFIAGTGLKKCIPTNRSARDVAAAISPMVRLDVFDAKIVSAPQSASSCAKICDLAARSSTTASITMSALARSSAEVVKRISFSADSLSAPVALPFSIALSNDLRIAARARSPSSSETSRTVVAYPLAAHTCAIPDPMSPPPSIATCLMLLCVSVMSASPVYLSLGCQRVEESRGATRFTVLQSVQHLLERERDTLGEAMVPAKDEIRTAASDRDRKRSHPECQAQCDVRKCRTGNEGSAGHDSGGGDSTARAHDVGA